MCKTEKDSNIHMLIECPFTHCLWLDVENWIRMENYCLTNNRKILADLESSGQIDILILNTNKTIFLSKLEERKPTLHCVKAYVRLSFLHDEYKYIINNRENIFVKKWSLFIRYYNNL